MRFWHLPKTDSFHRPKLRQWSSSVETTKAEACKKKHYISGPFVGATSPKNRKSHFWITNCKNSLRNFKGEPFLKTLILPVVQNHLTTIWEKASEKCQNQLSRETLEIQAFGDPDNTWPFIWAKFGLFECYYLSHMSVIIWAKFVLAQFLMWFQAIFAHSVIIFILCSFGVQLSGNFPKMAFLGGGAKLFSFPCFKFDFWKMFLFLFCQSTIKQGFQKCFVFLLFKEKKRVKTKWYLEFLVWIFWSKSGRFVTVNCFGFLGLLQPLFLWCFGPSCQKCFLDKTKKTLKISSGMLSFSCFLSCFSFFFCFCFLRGFKGQMKWPVGPPHLALNPPYLFWFFFFGGLRVRWGGPKGHLTWPYTIHILCVCFVFFSFCLCFLFVFRRKNRFSP